MITDYEKRTAVTSQGSNEVSTILKIQDERCQLTAQRSHRNQNIDTVLRQKSLKQGIRQCTLLPKAVKVRDQIQKCRCWNVSTDIDQHRMSKAK